MQARLRPSTILLLATPPLTWAANVIVGRMVHPLVPPMTLNLLRWLLALLVLLPLAHAVFRRDSPLWPRWRHYLALGLAGVGSYNSLQYLALKTSQPINATLVGAGTPIWMLLVGWLFFGARVRRVDVAGAALSMAGVLTVLCRGNPARLADLHLVPGDALMVLATIVWAFYGWMLAKPPVTADGQTDPIRNDWAAFLAAQVLFGLMWASVFTTAEWTLGDPQIHWGWPLVAAIAFVGLFPSIVAYRAYGAGVQLVGPTIAAFFGNLTPVFAALLSAAFLGEPPRVFHAVAFALIAAGIAVSARRS
ncbi:DMT family transporter [Xylophilus sp. GOD-11R]|uniref:DMT family transporter n=1 Tax=Xylophilus sp. GOD-11R TaxID=3089814 RepID=UPI00298C4076|nr:DMT family transporter [Xylophilus sp. GOD-11R]WPB55707.1 DMT family transporter [Xylophilus sp. GOD-11R]